MDDIRVKHFGADFGRQMLGHTFVFTVIVSRLAPPSGTRSSPITCLAFSVRYSKYLILSLELHTVYYSTLKFQCPLGVLCQIKLRVRLNFTLTLGVVLIDKKMMFMIIKKQHIMFAYTEIYSFITVGLCIDVDPDRERMVTFV